jgi:hypothetical protein
MKNRKIAVYIMFSIATSLALSACGSIAVIDSTQDNVTPLAISQADVKDLNDEELVQESETNDGEISQEESQDLDKWVEDLPRIDDQGAVIVEMRPQNLNSAWTKIEFQVSMNTHSVDLGMDLAALATLTTDTGYSVKASEWITPQSGGHHVNGTLIFPSSVDDIPILEGARQITLTLVDVDAPERVFVWER